MTNSSDINYCCLVANPPLGESPALPVILAQIPLAFLSIVIANFAQNTLTILNIDAQFLRWR